MDGCDKLNLQSPLSVWDTGYVDPGNGEHLVQEFWASDEEFHRTQQDGVVRVFPNPAGWSGPREIIVERLITPSPQLAINIPQGSWFG